MFRTKYIEKEYDINIDMVFDKHQSNLRPKDVLSAQQSIDESLNYSGRPVDYLRRYYKCNNLKSRLLGG